MEEYTEGISMILLAILSSSCKRKTSQYLKKRKKKKRRKVASIVDIGVMAWYHIIFQHAPWLVE
jgi:hypothetical protein